MMDSDSQNIPKTFHNLYFLYISDFILKISIYFKWRYSGEQLDEGGGRRDLKLCPEIVEAIHFFYINNF